MKNKKKLIILTSIIVGVLVVTLGLTYAAISFNETKGNSQLVLGDIWMHYNETTNTINIDNMLPMNAVTLNTSEEAVNKCVNYLYTTYGSEWNGLYYDNMEESSSKNQNSLANFMGIKLRDTYTNYCGGAVIKIYSISSYLNQNNYMVRPIEEKLEPLKEITILTDYENGILTQEDKNYFLENNILIDNVKNLDYFEFLVDGKNTHTKGSVVYNIQLVEGDEVVMERSALATNRIDAKYLRFRLTEVNGEGEIILKDNMQYDSLTNVTIHSDAILKNTTSEINRTYRLYMWIDGNVIIGNTSDANYSMEEWNNLYATVKVNVNGKYVKEEVLSEKIKNKLGTEGLVAVNTNGDLYDGIGEIREYRYSGIGNYCTYTDGENDYNLSVEGNTCPVNACLLDGMVAINDNNELFLLTGKNCTKMGGIELPLKVEGSIPTDSGLRNYVEFNGELWRIVGVFGDNVKIVKDTPLANGMYKGETYTIGDTTYNLKFTTEGTKYGYYIFKHLSDNTYNNDWTTSGLMHYLNDETGNSYYVNNLSNEAKEMIEETTYHLGNISVDSESWMISGTVSEVYNQEKGSVICGSDVNEWSNDNSCNIWNENQSTWTGKIGLLYPSDYGYATSSNNWTTNMGDYYHNGGSLNNWMFNTDAAYNWFLSPSASMPNNVLVWYNGYIVPGNSDYFSALLPVLNLKSTVMTILGDGSYNNPYKLLLD